MSNQKQQHYVPESYLKNFCTGDGKFFVFNKESQVSKGGSPNNYLKEHYFYDFPVSSLEDKRRMENFLSTEVDGPQNKLIGHLQKKIASINKLERQIAFNINVLTSTQKKDLSKFVAIQFLRTRHFRNVYEELKQKIEHFINPLLETDIYTGLNKLQTEYAFQEFNAVTKIGGNMEPVLHNNFILNHDQELAEKLDKFIWIIGVNKYETPIYTSDHPVVRCPHSNSHGLFSEGSEIIFPLDPELILLMLEPRFFQRFSHRDCKLMELNPDEIKKYNSLQVTESNRFIFCSHDSFDLARQLCQDYPEICLLNRERIQVTTNTEVRQEGFTDEQ